MTAAQLVAQLVLVMTVTGAATILGAHTQNRVVTWIAGLAFAVTIVGIYEIIVFFNASDIIWRF